ncbi:MAG: M3 family oligoendopeptidase [Thermoproteota archaeon]|jgi:oligoendopeptidase F|nr:M3 family oligoendopeptidase [Thermoproteota archaeon]
MLVAHKKPRRIGPWDLSDLVKDPNNKEFEDFVKSIERTVSEIENKRKSLSNDLTESDFQSIFYAIEQISEKVSIVDGYAHLRYSANTSSNEAASLLTRMDMMAADIANRLLFFDLWFRKELDEMNAQRLIESMPKVYKEYLKHKRLLAKYVLTEPEEKLISTLEVTGPNALVKIYDRMVNGFEYVMVIKKNQKLTMKKFSNKEKLLSYIRSTKPEERKSAYQSLLQVYKKNSGVLGEIYQNLVLQWRDENVNMRGYESPISVRNASNNLDDTTVQTLLKVCTKNSPIFQDYFIEKAKMIGRRKLRRYDLYAPLSLRKSDQRKFTFSEAINTVLDTFGGFDERFRKFSERIFDEHHVDSEIRKNKQGGAFCSTISPKKTPYVLVNFDGKSRDVSTMAHELGHAIHSIAASDKPITVAHAPLPLAETASVFAEILLNEKLLKSVGFREQRILLAEQIDDMYATIMRQAYFTLFEMDAHRIIARENATTDRVSELYLSNLSQQFGDSVIVSTDFQWEWTYIPHFYHSPFYCYAYSFGNLLVLSLYQQFKNEGRSFIPMYFNILASGGSRKPEELLKDSGMDISRDDFWQQGFDLLGDKIKELKKML